MNPLDKQALQLGAAYADRAKRMAQANLQAYLDAIEVRLPDVADNVADQLSTQLKRQVTDRLQAQIYGYFDQGFLPEELQLQIPWIEPN